MLCSATWASAEEEGAESDDAQSQLSAEERKRLEVITVSAERRDRDVQEVPESVSSFSGGELLVQGLINFNTLQYNVPGLFSGGGLTKITLRGVGGEIVGPGVDPGFSVHVNNVFSSRETTGLVDYFDVDRVDVLRGPQGTLWGRNSTAGRSTSSPTGRFIASTRTRTSSTDSSTAAPMARASAAC